jgi:predicted ThiF/HesA family dinucleotide-utilizing enzyme
MSVIFIPPSSAASIADATETSAGKIRIATSAEATAGTNDVTAMTPAKVKAVVEAAVAGGVTYQGTFDAGSPADLSNALKGDLYIISGAGTYAGRSWAVGDHLLVNADMGGTLDSSKIDKIDSTDSVTSVAGRTGAVVLSAGDVSGLAAVATTGAYSDLSGTPSLAAVATTGAYSDLSGTPTLATVATSGAYSDLSGLPTLGTAAALNVGTSALNVVQLDASARLPAVDGSLLTNLPLVSGALDDLSDVTITTPSDRQVLTYDSATSEWVNSAVAYADVSGTPTLATVATSGAYSDLSGTPTLATVATTGAYSDLSGLPTLGTAAALNVGTSALNVVQLDASAKLPAVDGSALTNLPSGATTLDALTDVTISSATNGQALIYNSSTSQWVNAQVAYANVSGTPTLATVATTGAYSDLSGLPTLGTAAALDVGTSALNVVQLDASAKLPAVDGSQLTNLPSGATTLDALTDVTITSVSNGQALTYNSATSAWVNSTLQQPGLTSAAPGSSYTISTTTNGSHVYILTPSTDCAVSLPAAATAGVGYIYHIKNLSIYALTITPQAGETIDNASTFVSAAQYGCVTIVSDGGNWWII